MAYNKKEILEKAKVAIKKHELTTIAEVLLYLPVEKSTIHQEEWLVDFLHPLKEALEDMKTQLKEKMKKKWRKSESAILQIASFKLMANEEEREVLNPPKVQLKKNDDGGTEITLNL